MSDELDQPWDELSERAVLGAMLAGGSATDEALGSLDEHDFYLPAHQTLFAVLRDMRTAGQPVGAASAATRLSDLGRLEQVGGVDALAALVSAGAAPSGVSYFIGRVRDGALRRRVIQAGTRIVQLGRTPDANVSASDIAALAMDAAFALGDDGGPRDCCDIHDVSKDMLERLDAIQRGDVEQGVPTGFRRIDDVTGGLQPGQMIVVAARPAMGKSTLALDFARHAALHECVPTVMFSLEMSGEEISQRLFSAETDIPLAAFRHPDTLTPRRWDDINRMYGRLEGAPLWVDDSPDVRLADIRFKCKQLKQAHGLGLVVVDYLQLMSSGRSVENRQQEVSAFSRGFKMLAKELGVPVVVLSQLNRGPEMRGDKKPQLSDLRESGAIEQDADMVFLLHRPDAYDPEDRPGEADVILAKHRNGPTDTFPLAFLGATSRFADMADMAGL